MSDRYLETRYTPDPGRRRVWQAIVEYLQPHVPPGGSVLDLGAGYCDFVNQIRASRRYALDRSADFGRFCADGVQFLHSEVVPIGLPDNSLDAVFASNLLEHLDDGQLARLSVELRRVLRPSGTLILVQPNIHYCYREYWDDYTHVKALSHVSLADLVASWDFEILEVQPRFLPFSFKSRLPKSYWLTKLYLALPWRPMAKQMLLVARRK